MVLRYHFDSALCAKPLRLTCPPASHLSSSLLYPSIHLSIVPCLPWAIPKRTAFHLCWLKKLLNWPVWLNEEGQYRLPFSTHYLHGRPFHPFPHCCLHFRVKAIPGPARSGSSAACQTSHSDTLSLPFFCLCQPSTSSSHRLSWKAALFCCARSCIPTLLHSSRSQSYQAKVVEIFKMDYFTPN